MADERADAAQIPQHIRETLVEYAHQYDTLRLYSFAVFRYIMYHFKYALATRLSVNETISGLWLREIVYALAGIAQTGEGGNGEEQENDTDTEGENSGGRSLREHTVAEARHVVTSVVERNFQSNSISLNLRNVAIADRVVEESLGTISEHIGSHISQAITDYAVTSLSEDENKVNEYGRLKYEETDRSAALVEVLVTTHDDSILQDYPEFRCVVNRRAERSVQSAISDSPLLCFDLFYSLQNFLFQHRRPYTEVVPGQARADVVFDRSLLEAMEMGQFVENAKEQPKKRSEEHPEHTQHIEHSQPIEQTQYILDLLDEYTANFNHTTNTNTPFTAVKVSVDKSISFVYP